MVLRYKLDISLQYFYFVSGRNVHLQLDGLPDCWLIFAVCVPDGNHYNKLDLW